MEPRILSQDIGDASLSYLLYKGDGPAIVMLHATGFLPWLWDPIARELAPSFRVIAPYFCDHRDTDPNRGGLSWLEIARDLTEFCRRLDLDRPLLVGHSMGATVLAIAHADCGLAAGGMLLVEPIFLPRDYYRTLLTVEDHPLASKAIRRTNHWPDEDAALAYLRSRALFEKWDEEMLRLYIRYGMIDDDAGGLTLTCAPEREAALFMGGMQYDPWPVLPRITCPVLMLEGETSENRAFIDLKEALSHIPHAPEYRLIPDAGHLLPMEQPRTVTEILRDFIRRLS